MHGLGTRRRRIGAGLVGVFAVLIGATLASTTTASGAVPGIDIDHVEVSDDDTVSVVLGVDRLPAGVDPAGFTVRLDDTEVDATIRPLEAGAVKRTVVMAIDTSASMRGARIAAARRAADAFVDAAPADLHIGLVTFSGRVTVTTRPTTDHRRLAAAIDDLSLTRGTRVYDALVRSVRLAGDTGARSVLLLSDGRDRGAGAGLTTAIDTATASGVVVDVVSLGQVTAQLDDMAELAEASGGAVLQGDAATLPALFSAEADALAGQLLVTFPRPEGAGAEVELEVQVRTSTASYSDAAYVTLPVQAALSDATVAPPAMIGHTGFLIGAGALGLGLALLLTLVMLSARGQSAAQRHLAQYLGDNAVGETAGSGLRRSAVGLADTVVKGEPADRLRIRLNGAGVSTTPAEWVLGHTGTVVLSGFVGLVFGGSLLMVVLLLAGAALPWWWLRRRHAKRLAAFGAQLPETLNLIAGGLSAGLSLPQAVDTVVREGHEPMAGELRRALVEQRLGIEIEDALEAVAERMQSEDFAWIVMAVRIQHEVGGNLAEILNTVADTLREREYLRRQVRTLSAEGRLSACILGVLPVLMFGYMFATNRDYLQVFWTEAVGLAMLTGAVVLLGLGVWFMSRLVKVQV